MEPDRLGRRVWALFTPYRVSLVAIVVAVLVSSGLGIITPFLTQAAFDRALFPLGGGPVRLGLRRRGRRGRRCRRGCGASMACGLGRLTH